MKKQVKQTAGEQMEVLEGGPLQVIYADAIINAGFGPAVSRITFGVEAGPRKLSPFATVVIPTHRLIEGLTAMQSLLDGNAVLKAELLKGLGAVKNTVEKIGK